MTLGIFALVLIAALIDSVSHVLIKSSGDPYRRSLGVAIVGGCLSAPLLFVTGLPDPASWPILAISIMFGSLYWFALGWAYRHEALAVVFPLSRGAGILLTVLGGRFILQEHLNDSQTMMLTLILGGLGLIVLNKRPLTGNAILPSACLALILAGYTLLDAVGVRLSGSPLAYCFSLYVGNCLVISAWTIPRIGLRTVIVDLPNATLAAIMSITVYAMVLYALAHGPVAIVSALSETSILFTALIGIFWLRERTNPSHSIGLALIAAGVILLRLDLWAGPVAASASSPPSMTQEHW